MINATVGVTARLCMRISGDSESEIKDAFISRMHAVLNAPIIFESLNSVRDCRPEIVDFFEETLTVLPDEPPIERVHISEMKLRTADVLATAYLEDDEYHRSIQLAARYIVFRYGSSAN